MQEVLSVLPPTNAIPPVGSSGAGTARPEFISPFMSHPAPFLSRRRKRAQPKPPCTALKAHKHTQPHAEAAAFTSLPAPRRLTGICWISPVLVMICCMTCMVCPVPLCACWLCPCGWACTICTCWPSPTCIGTGLCSEQG